MYLLIRAKEDAVGDVLGVVGQCLLGHSDLGCAVTRDTRTPLIHLVDGTVAVHASGREGEGGEYSN